MRKKDQADLFIRLLAEAHESDPLARNRSLAVWHKARARKSKAPSKSDLTDAMQSMGPPDCIQLMKSNTPDLGIG